MNHQNQLQDRRSHHDQYDRGAVDPLGKRGSFQRHIPRKPKVNILIAPVQELWQAKVHRADTGSVIYETKTYVDKQAAAGDARQWAYKNSHPIGKTFGLR